MAKSPALQLCLVFALGFAVGCNESSDEHSGVAMGKEEAAKVDKKIGETKDTTKDVKASADKTNAKDAKVVKRTDRKPPESVSIPRIAATVDKPPTPPTRTVASGDVKAIVDEMCKCKDKTCINNATARVGKHMRAQLQSKTREEKATWMVAFQKKHAAEFKRGDKCRNRILGKRPGASGPINTALVIKNMNQFATKMCACKDAECARGVNSELMMWVMTYFKSRKKPSKALETKLKPSQKKYTACFAKLYRSKLRNLNKK